MFCPEKSGKMWCFFLILLLLLLLQKISPKLLLLVASSTSPLLAIAAARHPDKSKIRGIASSVPTKTTPQSMSTNAVCVKLNVLPLLLPLLLPLPPLLLLLVRTHAARRLRNYLLHPVLHMPRRPPRLPLLPLLLLLEVLM